MPALTDRQHWTPCYWRIRRGFFCALCLIRRLCLPGSDNILRVPVIAGSKRGREAHGEDQMKKARERFRLAGYGFCGRISAPTCQILYESFRVYKHFAKIFLGGIHQQIALPLPGG
jgi:hypothetical protein